jgi:hypothetical protein
MHQQSARLRPRTAASPAVYDRYFPPGVSLGWVGAGAEYSFVGRGSTAVPCLFSQYVTRRAWGTSEEVAARERREEQGVEVCEGEWDHSAINLSQVSLRDPVSMLWL